MVKDRPGLFLTYDRLFLWEDLWMILKGKLLTLSFAANRLLILLCDMKSPVPC